MIEIYKVKEAHGCMFVVDGPMLTHEDKMAFAFTDESDAKRCAAMMNIAWSASETQTINDIVSGRVTIHARRSKQ